MREPQLKYNHANFCLDCGRRALVKCEECHKENYATKVLTGVCAWCGYDINIDNKKGIEMNNEISSEKEFNLIFNTAIEFDESCFDADNQLTENSLTKFIEILKRELHKNIKQPGVYLFKMESKEANDSNE